MARKTKLAKEKEHNPYKEHDRMDITRSEAIKIFCQDCMGWQKHYVKDCTDLECALWPYKLGQGRTEKLDTPIRYFEEKK